MKLSKIYFGIIFLLAIIVITLYFSIFRKSFHFLEGATNCAKDVPIVSTNILDNFYNTTFTQMCNEIQNEIKTKDVASLKVFKETVNKQVVDVYPTQLINTNTFKNFSIKTYNKTLESITVDMILNIYTNESKQIILQVIKKLIEILNDLKIKLEK